MKRAILLVSIIILAIGISGPAVSATWNDWKDKPENLKTIYFLGVYDGYDAMSGWGKIQIYLYSRKR